MNEGPKPLWQELPLPSEEDWQLFEEWTRREEKEKKEKEERESRRVVVIDL